MTRITRRSVVAAGAAGAALNAIPFSSWIRQQAYAQGATRVRHSAYSAQGKAMLKIYEKAVAEMMDKTKTPEPDPLSWTFQWYTHFVKQPPGKSSELSRVYPKPNAPHRALAQEMWSTCRSHNGQPEDYFLPWHRMYVYFFEMIIRTKAKDDSFTLPYWNYSNQADAAIPPEFLVAASPLHRSTRNAGPNGGAKIPANLVNLAVLKKKTYSPNGADQGFCATLDFGLHGNVHTWIGNAQGMAQIPWAANDPVFWMHHCNIDRLWASWNKGGCKNPTPTTWLDAKFTFADIHGNKVVGTVKDFDDIAKLHYTYDAFEAASCAPVVAAAKPTVLAALAKPTAIAPTAVRVNLAAPAPQGGMKAQAVPAQVKALAPDKSVYLVLENVHAEGPVGSTFDVYLDLPQGATPSPESPNYVGTISFFGVTMSPEMNAMKPGTFSLDITDKVKAIADALTETPSVTLVPTGEVGAAARATIGAVRLVTQ